MAERQQALAQVILQDPAVESLSSFIGIDGTNTTLNSGRIQINLKPLDERKADASEIIRRLQPELAKVEGITLFMQPVQDLTVEDRVSRTQFQYSLEDPDPEELDIWAHGSWRNCTRCRNCAMSRAINRTRACRRTLVIDRDTASRLGITPQMIDDTLYDAFGQRQVSTMFTQLNQYRVVLETQPGFQQGPDDLNHLYVRSPTAARCPSTPSPGLNRPTRRSPSTIRDSFRWSPSPSIWRPALRWEMRWRVEQPSKPSGCRRASRPVSRERPGVSGVAEQRADADSGRARDGLHRARRALRKLHPPDHDSLDAAVGRRRRACSL